jgi:hypothetical protein
MTQYARLKVDRTIDLQGGTLIKTTDKLDIFDREGDKVWLSIPFTPVLFTANIEEIEECS